jgi:hypothetical protein
MRRALGKLSERLDRLDNKHRLLLSQVTVAACVIAVAWYILERV